MYVCIYRVSDRSHSKACDYCRPTPSAEQLGTHCSHRSATASAFPGLAQTVPTTEICCSTADPQGPRLAKHLTTAGPAAAGTASQCAAVPRTTWLGSSTNGPQTTATAGMGGLLRLAVAGAILWSQALQGHGQRLGGAAGLEVEPGEAPAARLPSTSRTSRTCSTRPSRSVVSQVLLRWLWTKASLQPPSTSMESKRS